MENTNADLQDNKRSHTLVGWILLAGLFGLRIPFLTAAAILGKGLWADPIYQIGTYLLTGTLIYWERRRLADFNIDFLALLAIILCKPIQTIILGVWKTQNNTLAFPKWPGLIIWIISFAIFITFWWSRASLPRFKWRSICWMMIGFLVGFLTIVLLAYPSSLEVRQEFPLPTSILSSSMKRIPQDAIYQLGYAAVSEEPFFRGFLWGYLAKAKWKGKWIWLFQALLFTFGHLYYVNEYPISFWIIIPVCALVLGGLVWRSKTISSSIAAHGIINALLRFSGMIVAYFNS